MRVGNVISQNISHSEHYKVLMRLTFSLWLHSPFALLVQFTTIIMLHI